MTATARARLSVCCLTAADPRLVAASLGTLREGADDIVVAVDSRVDPARLGPLRAVADTLVRFEYVHPPELTRPWLIEMCRHDTVLMIDGDEVPSAGLLAALPELVRDESVVQWRIATRWLFPDERHWLAERPWWPDYHHRLLRRGPDLDFDLRVHGGVRPALPARYVDAPLYHLACLLVPFADRRARVRRYEASRPGMIAVGGGPMNDTLYVPEHFATLRPADTPAEDLRRLRAVLGSVLDAATDDAGAGTAAEATPAEAAAIPVVSAREIAARQPADPLEAQGYRVRLRVVELDPRTEPGNDTLVAVEVDNRGAAPIPHRDTAGAQIRLAARLLDPGSGSPIAGWALTPLPCDVPPGAARLAEVLVRIPAATGRYLLQVDLVNERGRWFNAAATRDFLVAARWGRYAPELVRASWRS